MAFDFIQTQLSQRAEQGLLRKRHTISGGAGALMQVGEQHYLNFSSNDYLAMRHHEGVLQAWLGGLSLYGAGSGASALVTGYSKAHQELEEYLAGALNREAVLLFNSGFTANQALCQALMAEGSTVLADKLIHASIIDGALHCNGELKRFKHNDVQHAHALLSRLQGDVLLATEGVFSMDGDQAPIVELVDLAQQRNAWLMLDDAHGFGVLGESGLGTVERHNLSQQQVPILMGTFGKAIGTCGAFVAGSQELIDYLLNFSRHAIYSTAMPPAQATATLASIELIQSSDRRDVLTHRIQQFKALMQTTDFQLLPSDSAIQPVVIGCPRQAVAISEKLKSLGIWVTPIRYPTVPKGSDRLRITLTAAHTEQDIHALVDALQLCMSEVAA